MHVCSSGTESGLEVRSWALWLTGIQSPGGVRSPRGGVKNKWPDGWLLGSEQ